MFPTEQVHLVLMLVVIFHHRLLRKRRVKARFHPGPPSISLHTLTHTLSEASLQYS